MPKPAGHTLTRIAAQANCSPATVRHWADGRRVHATTAQAIKEACAALGIAYTPPAPDQENEPREEKMR